jgi:hypothetical protein
MGDGPFPKKREFTPNAEPPATMKEVEKSGEKKPG